MNTFDGITDLETWLIDYADETIFRLWVYKSIFTPYEQDKKYVDESIYEDSTAKLVKLVGCIEMPNYEENILKFQDLDDDLTPTGTYYYYKFSQIALIETQYENNLELCVDND